GRSNTAASCNVRRNAAPSGEYTPRHAIATAAHLGAASGHGSAHVAAWQRLAAIRRAVRERWTVGRPMTHVAQCFARSTSSSWSLDHRLILLHDIADDELQTLGRVGIAKERVGDERLVGEALSLGDDDGVLVFECRLEAAAHHVARALDRM